MTTSTLDILSTYFRETNPDLYVVFSCWTLVVLVYAAWWDKETHRVPNWVWIGLLIPLPATFLFRDYYWDSLFLPILGVFCWGFRWRLKWGMGDAKGVFLAAFMIGAFPVAVAMMIAVLFNLKKRNVAFMVPFSYSMGAILMGVLGWFVWK